jgi:hypothetical protein
MDDKQEKAKRERETAQLLSLFYTSQRSAGRGCLQEFNNGVCGSPGSFTFEFIEGVTAISTPSSSLAPISAMACAILCSGCGRLPTHRSILVRSPCLKKPLRTKPLVALCTYSIAAITRSARNVSFTIACPILSRLFLKPVRFCSTMLSPRIVPPALPLSLETSPREAFGRWRSIRRLF